MTDSTMLSDPSRRWAVIWRVSAAATLVIFLWQWPFFFSDRFGGLDLGRVWGYALHHGYILAWLLLVTSFTRTIPLRTLAAFWFVGVFPVMAVVLLLTGPFGRGELASSYLGPILEEVIKPLPVLAFFAYRARRGGWQLSATDGLLLAFVVGAGFAFHEDAGYDRVWGDGFFANLPLSALFPTLGSSRSALLPGHDALTALVGLAIGVAFLYRRYRFAWVAPVAAWLIVTIEHVTGNLADIAGNLPLPAEILRAVIGGETVLAILVLGIVTAVVLESRILRLFPRSGLFPAIPLKEFMKVLRQRTADSLRRLQAMRTYVRQRRSLYYTLWTEPGLAPEPVEQMISTLYSLGAEAGVSVDQTFADYAAALDAQPPDAPTPAPAPADP